MSAYSSFVFFGILACVGLGMMAILGIDVAISLARIGEVSSAIIVLLTDAFSIAVLMFVASLALKEE